MPNFYQPDLGLNPDDPFARAADRRVEWRGYLLNIFEQGVVLGLTPGTGAHLAHLHKFSLLAVL